MINNISKEDAMAILKEDAVKIKNLVNKQRDTLCLLSCPAFEEVVDTQLFGFSREVNFVVRCALIEEKAGKKLIEDLESDLNGHFHAEF
ncbi:MULTISPECIES: DUF1507 family protein [Dellaglioa]|uniref:Uncharacterized protein n=3 Tax=Dellaglioa TaxID=2767880 RepID=A0A0R1HLB6_9LACO|nr:MULTISPECIES: DUF1507 family protein [Dellaglioa]KRK46329.1 hypothetical protein FC66_GL000832 [Dellaglioa algida DSM 15638]MCZ2490788.1 YlaN family protein [Dellaglioa carnosa]MCZ2493866.1 YlaN family protein [Dellaglioa carnosa]MDK1716332.1 YlaN family protein [Dellaglioa algida]MDK1718204.1 YlaN family protein [Dellaglioa algida]